MTDKAKLVLENGTVFTGKILGKKGETVGEICFNTGMTGYQEILTDPSYYGQLITMTYPHIGNYGTNPEDVESNNIQASGLIIKEETVLPSNFRSTKSLGELLRNEKIVGIQNIDTRMLTRIIRSEGAMNAIISSIDMDEKSLLNKVSSAPSMNGLDLAKKKILDEKYAILVEGYFDFLQLFQAGIKNVVAVSGTSFTDGHAHILKRLTKNIQIAYDGDSAGIAAAIRAGYVLLKNGLSPSIIEIPDGKDPDD